MWGRLTESYDSGIFKCIALGFLRILDGLAQDCPLPTTLNASKEVLEAANMLRGMGASQVFVFGSLVRGELRPDSDIDMAVSGLPAKVYFSAVSRASDILGRPVDLVDLDDDTALVRYLLGSQELIRVG